MSTHGSKILKLFTILLSFNFLLLTVSYATSVKLKLSATEIVDGSTLEVQIVAEGKNIEFPDIQDIGGFPVEGHSISSKLESSYINGKFSSKSLKTLRFEFYPEMNMTIPSFEIKISDKLYKTEPVAIKVVSPSEVTAKSADGYSLRIKSNKKSVYVGEPFIITVDFFEPRNSSVTKVEYTPPRFKDFFSQALGDEKLKRSAKGTLHQLRYLVSAKKDGKLMIIPPKARVGIRNFDGANRDPWGFFANDIKWHSVRANPLSIEVKPISSSIDMVGIFKIDTSVDYKTVKPNSPVTYTLKISGEGTLDDLADPKFDVSGVTIYGDDSKTTSKVVGGKIVSQYERKYVFISDKDFEIPSMTFRSFDYKSGTIKKLITKAYKIEVSSVATEASSKVTSQGSQVVNPTETSNESTEENESILEDREFYKKKENEDRGGYPLWALILSFFAGGMTMIAGGYLYRYTRQRRGILKPKHYSTEEALKILYPHTNKNRKVEAMVRKLYDVENGSKDISIDKDELAKMINSLQDQDPL
ncbi:MAG: protein BatD [Sulfurovum sp.]|nr:protein BatD [Sulfurovum sp.]